MRLGRADFLGCGLNSHSQRSAQHVTISPAAASTRQQSRGMRHARLEPNASRRSTMNLVRFDPFRELEVMSNRLNRLFSGSASGPDDIDGFGAWAPAMDVEEGENEYLVKTDLPDVKKSDVKIGIEDGVLTIEGERRQDKDQTTKKFHRVERVYGKFVRRIGLPTNIDAARVAADYKEGVLTIHLPKTTAAAPRSVEVKIA
jgi:HSP20 family protein